MKIANALAVLSAAALVATPVVAQAGTTASQSIPKSVLLSSMGERRSTHVDAKQNLNGGSFLLGFILGGAAGYALFKIIDDDKDKSNGT